MTVSRRQLHVRAYALTDVGRVREQNEDSHFAGTTAFAVADGMGGHQAGEIASETALEPVRKLDGRRFASAQEAQEALVQAVTVANEHVVDKAVSEPAYRGMGTTLTAVLLRDGQLHVAHVGDSRAYLLRDGEEMSQLTTDHTLVEQLVQEGRISRNEAAVHPQRSVITRAIGVERDIEVDSLPPMELQPGDQVLLCSDGLTGLVVDERIAEILSDTADGEEACSLLVQNANEAGGGDNITVVLLRAEPPEAETEAAAGSVEAEDTPVRIRTRQEETTENWAGAFSRLAAPQGALKRSETPIGRRRLRRVLATLTAVVVLLAVLAGGAWILLSRAFFVGVRDETVAIYRGVPEDVAGAPLHQLVTVTDVAVDDLAPLRRRRLRDGIPVESQAAANALVEKLRTEAEEAEEAEGEAQPQATSSPAAPPESPPAGDGSATP